MYGKLIISLFSVFFLTVLQLSFIDNLPGPFAGLDAVLVTLIFSLVLDGLDRTFYRAFAAGIFFGLFSFAPFGVHLISLCVFVLIADFLVVHFFTNRSIYSFLLLVVIGTIGYGLLLGSVNYLFVFFSGRGLPQLADLFDFGSLMRQLIYNAGAVFAVFHILNFFTNKLKPAFLVGSRN